MRSAPTSAAGSPILGTCAGMIVCDRDHLGLVDITLPAQRLRAPDRELRGGPRARRNRPRAAARGLHPRSVGRARDRARGRGARRGRRARGRGSRGPGDPLLLSSRADRRLAGTCVTDGDGDRGPGSSRRREGRDRMRDPRIENLARILVGYSAEVKEGDTCPHRGAFGGRAADRRDLQRGPDRRRAAGPRAELRRPAGRVLQARLRRSSWNGSRRCRAGGPRRPTAGSRSGPTPTPASSRTSRRTGRRLGARRPVS